MRMSSLLNVLHKWCSATVLWCVYCTIPRHGVGYIVQSWQTIMFACMHACTRNRIQDHGTYTMHGTNHLNNNNRTYCIYIPYIVPPLVTKWNFNLKRRSERRKKNNKVMQMFVKVVVFLTCTIPLHIAYRAFTQFECCSDALLYEFHIARRLSLHAQDISKASASIMLGVMAALLLLTPFTCMCFVLILQYSL